MKLKLLYFALTLFVAISPPAYSSIVRALGSSDIPGRHRGGITSLLQDSEGRFLSTGEDGFLGIWNDRAAEDRFQLSPHEISSMVLRPGRPEIAIIENESVNLNHISVWNYETKENLFRASFTDTVSFINYSAAGSFLIVSLGRSTVFIDSTTKEVLDFPAEVRGSIAMAVTGSTERIMISYHPTGHISYWDLLAGNELQRFMVPPNIDQPVLFGNNRFLAGFDSQGLVLIDVVLGSVLARVQSIQHGIFFVSNTDSTNSRGFVEFSCISFAQGSYTINNMEINLQGIINTQNRRTVRSANTPNSAIIISSGRIVMGCAQGSLRLLDRSGERFMRTTNPERIMDLAVTSSSLAFISENGHLSFIPLDYSYIQQDDEIFIENIMELSMFSQLYEETNNMIQEPEIAFFERSSGLPSKIVNSGRWFIVLDGEGSICWHDNNSGKLLAVFRLNQDQWVLERSEGEVVQGRKIMKPLN